jgi:hypothetical protein
MIRRWIERWLGYDRLLVAYEKVKRDNDNLVRAHAQLHRRHDNLVRTYQHTVENVRMQRAELAKLNRLYTRALVDLEWERFLAANNDPGSGECVKIRLMDHDQAWDVADVLSERFGKPMYAHYCTRCPVNPITRERWWHVTRKKSRRHV